MPEEIRIYADTNVYGRPFDDLSIPKVALEAESVGILFGRIFQRRGIILLGSDILKLEISRIKDIQKKYWVFQLTSLCKEWIEENERVKTLAQEICSKIKLSPRDSIHLASAIIGKAQHFLTFDEEDFLKKAKFIEEEYKIKVVSPIEFIKIS